MKHVKLLDTKAAARYLGVSKLMHGPRSGE